MKKFVAMLLAFVMVFALCACGDKPQNDKQDKAAVKVGFICLHDENSTYDKNFIDAAFTVDGKTLTSYMADVNTDANNEGDTEAVADGYFHESEYRSAPYFNVQIDGIKLLDKNFGN